MRERRQVEGKQKHESDDVTLYNTMTLIKRVHTKTHTGCTGVHVKSYNCELMKTSLHVCSAARTSLSLHAERER